MITQTSKGGTVSESANKGYNKKLDSKGNMTMRTWQWPQQCHLIQDFFRWNFLSMGIYLTINVSIEIDRKI